MLHINNISSFSYSDTGLEYLYNRHFSVLSIFPQFAFCKNVNFAVRDIEQWRLEQGGKRGGDVLKRIPPSGHDGRARAYCILAFQASVQYGFRSYWTDGLSNL